jgi:hypothetical protein
VIINEVIFLPTKYHQRARTYTWTDGQKDTTSTHGSEFVTPEPEIFIQISHSYLAGLKTITMFSEFSRIRYKMTASAESVSCGSHILSLTFILE